MIVMSSGGIRHDWFQKKSEDEKIGVDAISDEELKGFVSPVEVDEAIVEDVPVEGAPDGEVSIEVSEDIPGTVEDESLPSEKGEGDLSGRVADLVDDVNAVKEKLEDIAEDAADVAEMSGAEAPIDEVEIELDGDDMGGEAELEVSEEAPLESETTGEPEETENEVEDETDEDEEALVVAGDNRVFAKFASLSPDTKKKVADYFANVLGYDPEYSKLLVKEYN